MVVHEFALGRTTRTVQFGVSADGTGAFAGGPAELVQFVGVSTYLSELPQDIDVAAINIEGGEYELIPALFEANALRRVRRLYVQFHEVGEDPVGARAACHRQLSETHILEWNYEFIWECWVRRES